MKHLLHSLYYASSLSSILLRNVPPQSICPSGVRKKRGIPRYISQGLQAWFRDHGPYPNHAEKEMLSKKYGITLGQVTMLYGGSIENPHLECFDSLWNLVESTLVSSAKDSLLCGTWRAENSSSHFNFKGTYTVNIGLMDNSVKRCLRADVSYFLCCTCNKGNRRRLHAGKVKSCHSYLPTSFVILP